MKAHALLSASSAHRWLRCPPSARLEEEFVEKGSAAAEEGTRAHALAEQKLSRSLNISVSDGNLTADDVDMDRHTDAYVDFVLEILEQVKLTCLDPKVLIEQRVDFSRYVPEGFGTADCIIVGDGSINVIDLKYGQGVLVDSTDNPQMKLYALGALEIFDDLYDINEISMSIFQPRRDNIRSFTIPKDELIAWAKETLQPLAEEAFQGKGSFSSGGWCRFCRAAATCCARAEKNLELCRYDFASPTTLSEEDIERVLSQLEELTSWANDVKAYALEMAIKHGKNWQGFKIVEGRSNRKYKDENLVAEAAQKAGYLDIYKESLITLTQMERLMGKKTFSKVLGDLIEKPQGKATLVPADDRRPELHISKHEFTEVI